MVLLLCRRKALWLYKDAGSFGRGSSKHIVQHTSGVLKSLFVVEGHGIPKASPTVEYSSGAEDPSLLWRPMETLCLYCPFPPSPGHSHSTGLSSDADLCCPCFPMKKPNKIIIHCYLKPNGNEKVTNSGSYSHCFPNSNL